MINPFNYVPMISEYKGWEHVSSENQWGILWYKSQLKRVVRHNTFLVEKDIHERIKRFTAPIPLMAKYNEEMLKIESQMSQVVKNHISDPTLDINVSKIIRYKELSKQLHLEIRNRLSAGSGSMAFQFNVKVGIFGNNYIRKIVFMACEMTGKSLELEFKRINWPKYAYNGFKIFTVKIMCAIHNFRHRKEIAAEIAKAKMEYDRWHNEVFKDTEGD